MVRALVFDLDDTLYPESEYVRSGYGAVDEYLAGLALCRLGRFQEAAWSRFLAGGKRSRIFDEVLADLGVSVPSPGMDGLVEVYRGHDPAIRLYADAEAYLAAHCGSPSLGIITDGFRLSQRRKVAALALAARIPAVVYSDDFGSAAWKPAARPFEEMERLLKLPGSEMVYVGDNPRKDFIGARALGWKTVRMRRPGTLHGALQAAEGYGPDREISNFGELDAAISGWR